MSTLTAKLPSLIISAVFAAFSGNAFAVGADNHLEKFIENNGFANQIAVDDAALAELRGRSTHLPSSDLTVILWDEFDLNQNKVNTKNAPETDMYNISVSIEKP